jgi:NTP pyrophosphatase (non-canonical NTP hydrolase)
MTPALISQIFGLVGESGEVAEKFKKIIRDKQGALSGEDKAEILKELGDILWYVNSVASLLGSSLEEVAMKNLDKVLSRKARGVTKGSGDNR